MTVDLLVSVIVPVCVVVLMFSVGLSLTLSSLRSTCRHPRSLVLATLLQIVLLPACALVIISALGPAPVAAVAILAIAASPGGALSNAFTHMIGGNLALSVMMTTISTILVCATAPVVMAVALGTGVLEQGIGATLDPLSVAFDLLRLALLPIGLGVLAVQRFPAAAPALRRVADRLGVLAVATVLVSSAVVSWPVMQQTAPSVMVYAVVFSLIALLTGAAVSRALPKEDRSACVMEFGTRNLPVALILASGGNPPAELVAFLLGYFLVNASILVGATKIGRSLPRRVTA
jgi:bile acid:Na+ symporter, BASS family